MFSLPGSHGKAGLTDFTSKVSKSLNFLKFNEMDGITDFHDSDPQNYKYSIRITRLFRLRRKVEPSWNLRNSHAESDYFNKIHGILIIQWFWGNHENINGKWFSRSFGKPCIPWHIWENHWQYLGARIITNKPFNISEWIHCKGLTAMPMG